MKSLFGSAGDETSAASRSEPCESLRAAASPAFASLSAQVDTFAESVSLALPSPGLHSSCLRWEITPRCSDRERVIGRRAVGCPRAQLFRSSLYSHSHKFLEQPIPIYLATMSLPSDGLPRPYPQLPNSMLEYVWLSHPTPIPAQDLELILECAYFCRLFSMKGKVAIVTGGSGGIGFAAAEALAEMGGDIALQYRSAEGMDERAAELGKRFNVKCKAYRCDVSDYEGVQKLVQDVKSEFGRIDVFIANVSLREGLFPNTSELTCISALRLVWYARALFAT